MTRKQIIENYKNFSYEHPYIASAVEGAAMYGAQAVVKKAGDAIGISLGHGRRNNQGRLEFIKAHPFVAAAGALAWAPISEELMFRQFPDKILERYSPKSARKGKLAAVALFAAAHAGPDAVPLPQLTSGLQYQKIYDNRGSRSAIVAHATHNLLAAGQFLISERHKTVNVRHFGL